MLLVRLLFLLSVSNAKVEQICGVSKENREEIPFRSTTNDILTIVSKGPHLAEYHATEAVQAWHFSKVRRFNQKISKSYKTKTSAQSKIS